MVHFKVDKGGCGGCAKSVTRSILAVEPNVRVEVDLGAELVTISGTAGPADRLALTIAADGFLAKPLSAAA